MRTALLLGRDHLELGAIGAISEGAVAIALSKGGALKTYPHIDPNEDAAAFAIGAAGLFVAVADGHHGAEGAELALEHLLVHCAPGWTGTDCAQQDEAAHHAHPNHVHLHARAIEVPKPGGGILRASAPLPAHLEAALEAFGFAAMDPEDRFPRD